MTNTRGWRERYLQAGRDAVFLLILWPVLLVAFVTLVPLTSFSAGTVVIWVGVPLLVFTLHVASGVAELGRRTVAIVDSSEYLPGHYQQPRPGVSGLRRGLQPLSDPQRWLDLIWVLVEFGVSLVTWVCAVVWLCITLVLPLDPLLQVLASRHLEPLLHVLVNRHLVQDHRVPLAGLLGLEPTLLWVTLVDLAVWVIFVLAAPYVLRILAAANQVVTRALLCGRSRVGQLETSRAAVRRAEADTRRALERDIHDGPQQRLVRLGMDLARARRQVARDPQAAEATITGTMEQAQEALDELRRLSRGIAPPVLVDRGLSAALSELAARSAVPVTAEVDLPRLAEHVEHAAYFVASEAVANLNKHSGAGSAWLTARVEQGSLLLEVGDDGAGGASLAKGHGLAGLVERLAGVDGHLEVSSPAGGPTRVKAVIPCAS